MFYKKTNFVYREALDSMRTSHMAYMGGGASSFDNVNDDSKITQLKRTTPNGIQVKKI